MLAVIAVLGYLFFVFLTAALVWATGEPPDAGAGSWQWEPGTNPHRRKF